MKRFSLRNLAAQPRQDRGKRRASLRFVERLVFLAAERRRVAAFRGVFRLDVRRGFLDEVERVGVALPCRRRPR